MSGGFSLPEESALGETRTPMGYPTRTSSVRVCHFATSAGRPRVSLKPDLSLKFSLKNGVGADFANGRFRLASLSRAAILAIIE
jgi:hypothetical protein